MKWNKSFIVTMREDPKEAESKSHRILLKAGFVRQLASGIYSYLPLAWRTLLKITGIVREEMNRIGGQELLMPVLSPREIWEASGRWQDYGNDMFRLKDRREKDFALSPTHEEVVTLLAARAIRSYRDLPQTWYQIQTKFRDEPRPRFGVIRVRQFIMKDSYSFDIDDAGLDISYRMHYEAYQRIFKRCGLNFFAVQASGGIMGKGESSEFMAPVPGGENRVVICDKCGYKANLDIACSVAENIRYPDESLHEVATPGQRTVAEVSTFLKNGPERLVKSMVFVNNQGLFLILIRGDYEISEEKLRSKFGFETRPATNEEVKEKFGADVGFIGPQNIKGIKIYADQTLKGARGMITGANRNDYHVIGLNLERDCTVEEYIDIKMVKENDRCSVCDGSLKIIEALELGHLFKLGTKYSKPLKAKYLDRDGNEQSLVMGSYGIGVERIMACACEQLGDDNGAVWPLSIAPFETAITTVNVHDRDCYRLSEDLYQRLLQSGVDVIWDDRDENPGVKFNDRDLVGFPIGITIGPRGIKEGRIDVVLRGRGEKLQVAVDKVCETVLSIKARELEALKP